MRPEADQAQRAWVAERLEALEGSEAQPLLHSGLPAGRCWREASETLSQEEMQAARDPFDVGGGWRPRASSRRLDAEDDCSHRTRRSC